MFCPICGAESTQGLNYCKRCGGSLSPLAPNQQKPLGSKPLNLLLPVSLVAIVGLIGFFATVVALAEGKIDSNTILGFCAFGGATVVGVVGSLIWLLLKISGSTTAAINAVRAAGPVISDAQHQQLPEPRISIPGSVTEHTTRGFEQMKSRERTSQ